jgi:hypothetical protein
MEMIIRKTKNYELDFQKTLPYFLDHIKCGKTLSEKVVEKIDFSKGSFSTILPSNIHLDKLFDFNQGGIICSEPYGKESYPIEGLIEDFQPRQIVTMDYECSEFISNFLSKDHKNWAVVENYMLDPKSPYVELENVRMFPFDSDVYYFLNKKNSINEIYKTLRRSSQVWHFLAVLTQIQDEISIVLTDSIIDHICTNVKSIIAGAYDGEGYIFWQRRES